MLNKELKQEYIETINKVQELLEENNEEWVGNYRKYAEELKENEENYKEIKNSFRSTGLDKFTSLSRVKNKGNIISVDLRYKGHSVGEVFINSKDKSKKLKPNMRERQFPNYPDLDNLEKCPWDSEQAVKFRTYFNNEEGIPKIETNRECQLEHKILHNMENELSGNKILTNIQPVKLAECYFQMPTPIKASEDLGYSAHKGGGIDILARRGTRSSKLCVIELKDESERNESSTEAIKQAISYATFIHALLGSEEAKNDKWWKIFGINSNLPEPLIIKTVIMMPYGEYSIPFDKTELNLTEDPDGDKLELNYLFFDPDDLTDVDTSL